MSTATLTARISLRTKLPDAMRLLGVFVRRLTVTDTTLAEFQTSLTFMAIGALLSASFQTLSQPFAPYRLMLHVASEPAWAAVFLLLGAAQSAVNIFQWAYGRKLMAFCGAVMWGLLFTLGWMACPAGSFFVPVCGSACVVQALVYLRLGLLQEVLRRA